MTPAAVQRMGPVVAARRRGSAPGAFARLAGERIGALTAQERAQVRVDRSREIGLLQGAFAFELAWQATLAIAGGEHEGNPSLSQRACDGIDLLAAKIDIQDRRGRRDCVDGGK